VIYRFQLNPVMQSGTRVMDKVLAQKPKRKVRRRSKDHPQSEQAS
jgi:hypothetical protein